MANKPTTVAAYLAALPKDRLELVETILGTIRENADAKLEEGLQYGMPAFFLPHSVYPNGYHCDPKQPLPFASVASRASGVSIYLFCVYCDPAASDRLRDEWKATGKRLDMGKSCIRVKKLDAVPLDVLGAAVRRMSADEFVRVYEESVPATRRKPAKKVAKKPAKKATAKKSARKSAKKSTQ